MKLEDMTWDEAVEKCKGKVILVPHGSTEQHGYHLPLKTDALVAEKVCAEFYSSKEVVVAPVMRYTGVNSGKQKPGTVGLDEDTHINNLKIIIRDLLKLHPKKIIFFLAHNWGRRTEEKFAPLKEEFGKKVNYVTSLSKLAIEQGIIETGGHAGEGETSLMLYLDEKNVKMKKAVDEQWPKNPYESGISKSGASGYPSKATAGKGKKLFGLYVKKLKEALK